MSEKRGAPLSVVGSQYSSLAFQRVVVLVLEVFRILRIACCARKHLHLEGAGVV